MATREFRDALGALIALAARHRVAIMCAEAKWWQCHRQLIGDALAARGIESGTSSAASRPPRTS